MRSNIKLKSKFTSEINAFDSERALSSVVDKKKVSISGYDKFKVSMNIKGDDDATN